MYLRNAPLFMFVVTITMHILSNDIHGNLDTDPRPPKLHEY